MRTMRWIGIGAVAACVVALGFGSVSARAAMQSPGGQAWAVGSGDPAPVVERAPAGQPPAPRFQVRQRDRLRDASGAMTPPRRRGAGVRAARGPLAAEATPCPACGRVAPRRGAGAQGVRPRARMRPTVPTVEGVVRALQAQSSRMRALGHPEAARYLAEVGRDLKEKSAAWRAGMAARAKGTPQAKGEAAPQSKREGTPKTEGRTKAAAPKAAAPAKAKQPASKTEPAAKGEKRATAGGTAEGEVRAKRPAGAAPLRGPAVGSNPREAQLRERIRAMEQQLGEMRKRLRETQGKAKPAPKPQGGDSKTL